MMYHKLREYILFSILALSTYSISQAKQETYEIEPLATNARFMIDHYNVSSNVGGFYELTGKLQYDEDNQTGSINISIPIKSLRASSSLFTEHLKAEDFFNEKRYPEMKFTSTEWYKKGGKLSTISGRLTLLGKTRPVTLTVDKFGCYQRDPSKLQKTCGADLSTTIDRTKWGMNTYADIGDSRHVKINIQIEANKK